KISFMVYCENYAPSVVISSPVAGASASDIEEIRIEARDGLSGVKRIEFYIDEELKMIKNEDGQYLFQYFWDTTEVSYGTHTLKAVVYDHVNKSSTTERDILVDNSGWEREDAGYDAEGRISFDVSSTGDVYTAYYDEVFGGQDPYHLTVAIRENGMWSEEYPDLSDDVGYYPSLKLDSYDSPCIAYYDNKNSILKYTDKKGGFWNTYTVNNSSGSGEGCSMLLDANGYGHISYVDRVNLKIMYSSFTGTEWTVNEVEDIVSAADRYTSIVRSTDGIIGIAYYDTASTGLMYSVSRGTYFETGVVDNSAAVGKYVKAESDINGKIHVIYYDETNDDLKYVLNSTGTWVDTIISTETMSGVFFGMDTDSNGYAHVSYSYTGDHCYIYYNGSEWKTSDIDIGVKAAGGSSIVIDNGNKPHFISTDSSDNISYTWWQQK
ncbi:Ig-like domain-containing protein, partial [Elusimicrobiota bacterium]